MDGTLGVLKRVLTEGRVFAHRQGLLFGTGVDVVDVARGSGREGGRLVGQ